MSQEVNQDFQMAQRAQLHEKQQHYTEILNKIRNLIDVAAGLKIEDGNDLVQALKDDLLGIFKGGDPVRIPACIKLKDNHQKFNLLLQQLQRLVQTASQLHIDHARDYAPLMALIEDVKSICQGEPVKYVEGRTVLERGEELKKVIPKLTAK